MATITWWRDEVGLLYIIIYQFLNLTFKYFYKSNFNLDVRTDGWLLMDSPFPTTVICLCYVYLVKSLGPKLMRDRQPFELKKAILVYNAIQVIFSSVIVYKVKWLPFLKLESSFSIRMYLARTEEDAMI